MNSPFQFRLSHVFGLVAACAIGCALTASLGPVGLLLMLPIGGAGLVIHGFFHKNKKTLLWGAAILLATAGIVWTSSEGHWSGRKEWPVKFVVLDSQNDLPVIGAVVEIYSVDEAGRKNTLPPGVDGQDTTDARGEAVIRYKFPAGGKLGVFRDSGTVYFDELITVRVSSPVHETPTFLLEDSTGRSRDLRDPPLPVVTRLQPKIMAIGRAN